MAEDWVQGTPRSDGDERLAVAAHALLGRAYEARAAIELALADSPDLDPHGLLAMATSALDVLGEQLRRLAAGVPHEFTVADLMPRAEMDLRDSALFGMPSSTGRPGVLEPRPSSDTGYEARRISTHDSLQHHRQRGTTHPQDPPPAA